MAVSGDDSMGNCSIHAKNPATFKCGQCKRSYCPDCVGREEDGQIICSQCVAVETALRKKAELEESNPARKMPGIRLLHVFMALAVMGIGFNLYILFQDRAQPRGAEVVRAPAMSPQLAGIRECRHRLSLLAEGSLEYEKSFGRMPGSLADLTSLLDSEETMHDPISGLEYRLGKSAGDGLTIQCPSPAEHGVRSIYVQPGKTAVVEYAGQGNQP